MRESHAAQATASAHAPAAAVETPAATVDAGQGRQENVKSAQRGASGALPGPVGSSDARAGARGASLSDTAYGDGQGSGGPQQSGGADVPGLTALILDQHRNLVLEPQKEAIRAVHTASKEHDDPGMAEQLLMALTETALFAGIGAVGGLVADKLVGEASTVWRVMLSEAVGDGAKKATELGVDALIEGLSKREPSKDAFFDGQEGGIDLAGAAYNRALKDVLLAQADPVAAAKQIYDSFESPGFIALHTQSYDAQFQATLQGWSTFLAQGALGADKKGGTDLSDHNGQMDSLDMGVNDGLLQVDVVVDGQQAVLGQRAWVRGLNESLRSNFKGEPLGKIAVPKLIGVTFTENYAHASIGQNEAGAVTHVPDRMGDEQKARIAFAHYAHPEHYNQPSFNTQEGAARQFDADAEEGVQKMLNAIASQQLEDVSG